MKSPFRYTFLAACLALWLCQPLAAQSDFSVEWAFRDYVPELFTRLAARTGDTVRVQQAAFWRRDQNSFPWLSDGWGAEFLWNRDRLSFGTGLDVFGGFYAANSNYATNLSAQSDTTFAARLMTWGFHGKLLWHLKADHASSVFAGVKAGILLTGGGVVDMTNFNLYIPKDTAAQFNAIPTSDLSPALTLSLLAGLRIFLFEKFTRPYATGLRFTLEYAFATDTFPFRLGLWSRTKLSGYASAPTFLFNASGLMVSVALFLVFPEPKAKADPRRK